MRWQGQKKGGNIEDRRGKSGGKIAVGGGIGVIIIALLSIFTGKDLSFLNQFVEGVNSPTEQGTTLSEEELEQLPHTRSRELAEVVLTSTDDVWTTLFKESNINYSQPTLVIFENSTSTACGTGQAQMGPFYCPAEEKAYIDLSFCDELSHTYKAPGDFAIAYVIAHEIGHHIQNLQGRTAWMEQQRSKLSAKEFNKLSVKLELQADFYAGVWAHYSQKQLHWLDPSDISAALVAANAIGDDKLQMEAQGYVVPDAFTHGTSAQREYWFRKGYETGDLNQGKYENIK